MATSTKKRETTLWKWLAISHKRFKLYELDRIENATNESGRPDVFFCYKGVAGWVELKTTKDFGTRKKTINLKMSGEQGYFQNRYTRCGVNALCLFVLAQINII